MAAINLNESSDLDFTECSPPGGGYEYDFLSPVPVKWICLICQLPLKNPMQLTNCGHRICEECMKEVLRRPRAACPADRAPILREKVFPDAGCKREVEDLKVKCPVDQCTWTGEAHHNTCGYRKFPCKNQGCLERVPRKDMENHLSNKCGWRVVNCLFCFEKLTKNAEYDHVKKTCKRYFVSCENECGSTLHREEMENHLQNLCPLALLPCEYSNLLGCKEKIQRRKMKEHMESAMSQHLSLSCAKLEEQEKCFEAIKREHRARIATLDDKYKYVESISNMDKEETTFTWEFPCWSLRNRLRSKKAFYSDPFFLNGYNLILFICTREPVKKQSRDSRKSYEPRQLSLGFHVGKGKYDAELEWPFKKRFHFEFKQLLTGSTTPTSSTTFYVQPEQPVVRRCLTQIEMRTNEPSYNFFNFMLLEGNFHICRLTAELSD